MIILQLGNIYRIRKSQSKQITFLTDAETFRDLFRGFSIRELASILEYSKRYNIKHCLILAYDPYDTIKEQGVRVYHKDLYQRILDELVRRKKIIAHT